MPQCYLDQGSGIGGEISVVFGVSMFIMLLCGEFMPEKVVVAFIVGHHSNKAISRIEA